MIENTEAIESAIESEAEQFYFNEFAVGVAETDVLLVLRRNGKPQIDLQDKSWTPPMSEEKVLTGYKKAAERIDFNEENQLKDAPIDFKQWLGLLAQEKQRALQGLEEQRQRYEAKEAANKQMLSFLTHTLINTMGSVPSTLREIIKILGPNYQQKVINKVASLFTTFSLADTLIQTFKLYVAEPEQFESSWHQDNQGEGSIELVLAFALRQTVSIMLFRPVDEVEKLLPSGTKINIKALRHAFMNEVIALELDHTNAEQVKKWLTQNLNILTYDIDKTDAIRFQTKGIRLTFLFSILSEVIYNALKYSNGNRQIEISWKITADYYELTCCNAYEPGKRLCSTQKGLIFIEKLISMLNKSTVEYGEENNRFTIKLSFHKINFEASNHANTVN